MLRHQYQVRQSTPDEMKVKFMWKASAINSQMLEIPAEKISDEV